MAKKKPDAQPAEQAAAPNSPTGAHPASKHTRYQKVISLLDQAAGDSNANYQGLGRFWHQPYQDFLSTEIYGVRMIAELDRMTTDEMHSDLEDLSFKEALDKACCPVPVKGIAAPEPRIVPIAQPGRGAKSGLIKGLKGEFPFNSEYFKQLPWGGTPMAPEDIEYIAKWIDDGCPQDDHDHAPQVKAVQDGIVFKAFRGPTNIFKREFKQLKVRKCIDRLTPDEERRLRNAVWELVQRNKFPRDKRNMLYWGRLHGDECQHGWEQFLTWHRMFLYAFEQALQDIDPDVTLPYWDWTKPRYLGGQIPSMLKPDNPAYNKDGIAGVIPESLRCWLNQSAIVQLAITGAFSQDEIDALIAIKGRRFNAAQELFNAAGITQQKQRNLIYPELARVNPLWYQFRYPGMFYNPGTSTPDSLNNTWDTSKPLGVAGLKTYHHHFPTKADVDRIMKIDNWRDFGGGPDYDQSFGILDMDPHNTIHLWTGGNNPNYYWLNCNPDNAALSQDPNEPKLGDMFNNLTAAFDFIFWPHHVNIDRIFHNWQRKYPSQIPDDLNAALPGLGFAVRDALSIGRLGYEYAYDSIIFPTGRHLALGGFESETIDIEDHLRQFEGKVELRLHQVDQPQYSHGLKIFLNPTDSQGKLLSSTRDRQPTAFTSFFGHGECIGGPGHCDPPADEKRSNDIRGRHHNAPGNLRIDITDAFRQIVQASDAKGQPIQKLNLSMELVGPEGDASEPVLRMDGISINFID